MRSLSIFDPAFVGRLNGIGVSLNPESTYYYQDNAGASPGVTSETVTGTVIGGTPSYTYSWTKTAGDSTIGITSPSSSTTTFSKTGNIGAGGLFSATMLLTVSDSAAATGYSIPLSVNFELYPSTPP